MPPAVLQLRAMATLAEARRRLPGERTTATLRRLAGRRSLRTPAGADDALRAVQRAARLVGGDCLDQAVTLAALLQRSGRDPTLVLGCHQYLDRRWGAHAWVLLDGRVLDPRPSGHHDSLAWYRAADAWMPTAPSGQSASPGSIS